MAMILSGQVLMAGIMTIEVKSRNLNDDGLIMKPVRCHIDPQKLSFNQLCPWAFLFVTHLHVYCYTNGLVLLTGATRKDQCSFHTKVQVFRPNWQNQTSWSTLGWVFVFFFSKFIRAQNNQDLLPVYSWCK